MRDLETLTGGKEEAGKHEEDIDEQLKLFRCDREMMEKCEIL